MNKALKLIGLLLAGMLLSGCVHSYGYRNPNYGGGYYPGYGNNYRNYPQGRYSSNRPRPPAYGYWRNMGPRHPYNRGNNYYNQNNYYNRPAPPRPGYGYGPRPGYDGRRGWGDRDHDRHDHHSGGGWQGHNQNYARPPSYPGQGPIPNRGNYNPGGWGGNRPSAGLFGRHQR